MLPIEIGRGIKIRAQKAPWYDGVEILVIHKDTSDSQGRLSVVIDVTFGEVEDPGMEIEPTFHLDYTNAQLLIDDLWYCGFRPSEGTGSAGALKATEKHLDDMRKIVFNRFGIAHDE